MTHSTRPPLQSFKTPAGHQQFPEALAEYRKRLGYTNRDVADQLRVDDELGDVNERTVWRWTRPPGHRWQQVPDVLRQQRIIRRMRILYGARRRARARRAL